jgi:hypothetical protein
MAYGGADDVLVVLVDVAFFRDFAQCAGNIGGDAWFLGDDEAFGHEGFVRRGLPEFFKPEFGVRYQTSCEIECTGLSESGDTTPSDNGCEYVFQ